MKKKQHNHEADIENPNSIAYDKNQGNRGKQLNPNANPPKPKVEKKGQVLKIYTGAGEPTKEPGGGKSGKRRTTIIKK